MVVDPGQRSFLSAVAPPPPLSSTQTTLTKGSPVLFVLNNLEGMKGGEILIPKMNSIYIYDIIKFLSPKVKVKEIGTRPGEKIHETLCSKDETRMLFEDKNCYIIFPEHFSRKKHGKKIPSSFQYVSNSKNCLSKDKILNLIKHSGF